MGYNCIKYSNRGKNIEVLLVIQNTWQESALCSGLVLKPRDVSGTLPLTPQMREGVRQRKHWKSDEQAQKL